MTVKDLRNLFIKEKGFEPFNEDGHVNVNYSTWLEDMILDIIPDELKETPKKDDQYRASFTLPRLQENDTLSTVVVENQDGELVWFDHRNKHWWKQTDNGIEIAVVVFWKHLN